MVPRWFRVGSALVPRRFRVGSALVPRWFRVGSALVPLWLRVGSALVPRWFRVSSASVPRQRAEGSPHHSALVRVGVRVSARGPACVRVGPGGPLSVSALVWGAVCRVWSVRPCTSAWAVVGLCASALVGMVGSSRLTGAGITMHSRDGWEGLLLCPRPTTIPNPSGHCRSLSRERPISVGTCRALTASSKGQWWALPDLDCDLQISVWVRIIVFL